MLKKYRVLMVLLPLVMVGCWRVDDLFRVVGWVMRDQATVAERLAQYGESARERLRPHFQAVGVAYPPKEVVLVGLKAEKRLQLYAGSGAGQPRFIRSWPVLAASGGVGPKQREGDRQVPEGLYRIDSLNPNSRFHLSLRIDYPNGFDRRIAAGEGRKNLGGDIMIHGADVSIGCLAMGNPTAEELFVLVAETGHSRVRVILAPVDFRNHPRWTPPTHLPAWTATLYRDVRAALAVLPIPA